jgi:two-component system, response regulator
LKSTDYTVLIVEDDLDDLLMITEALKTSMYKVDIIHKKNGKEALGYLKGINALNGPLPSLIITDINMPVLSGREMIAILKSEQDFRSVPVIVFTTSSNDGDKEFCKQFNVHMVTKPNSIDTFEKEVREFIMACDTN